MIKLDRWDWTLYFLLMGSMLLFWYLNIPVFLWVLSYVFPIIFFMMIKNLRGKKK